MTGPVICDACKHYNGHAVDCPAGLTYEQLTIIIEEAPGREAERDFADRVNKRGAITVDSVDTTRKGIGGTQVEVPDGAPTTPSDRS